MDTKKIKEGISIREIEGFAKKHRFLVFFCLALVLSCLFSFVFFSGLSALFIALGALVGGLFPSKVESLFKRAALFFYKQEEITQLILGIVSLILSIFLPFVIFCVVGLGGGKFLRAISMDLPLKPEEEKE